MIQKTRSPTKKHSWNYIQIALDTEHFHCCCYVPPPRQILFLLQQFIKVLGVASRWASSEIEN